MDTSVIKFLQIFLLLQAAECKNFLEKLRGGTFEIIQTRSPAELFQQMKKICSFQFRFKQIIGDAKLKAGFCVSKIVIAAKDNNMNIGEMLFNLGG